MRRTKLPFFVVQVLLGFPELQCPYQLIPGATLESNASYQLHVPTKFPMRYRLRTEGTLVHVLDHVNDSKAFCDVQVHFGEFGVYHLTATEQTGSVCLMETLLYPVNVYLLMTFLFIALGFSILLWKYYGPSVPRWIKIPIRQLQPHKMFSKSTGLNEFSGSNHMILPPGT